MTGSGVLISGMPLRWTLYLHFYARDKHLINYGVFAMGTLFFTPSGPSVLFSSCFLFHLVSFKIFLCFPLCFFPFHHVIFLIWFFFLSFSLFLSFFHILYFFHSFFLLSSFFFICEFSISSVGCFFFWIGFLTTHWDFFERVQLSWLFIKNRFWRLQRCMQYIRYLFTRTIFKRLFD